MIEMQGLTKTYSGGSVRAVDDLSLAVPAGKVVGFLGPNGAGKTTTIKLIVGLLRPDAGRVVVNGIDNQIEPLKAKAQIGYIPDHPEVYDRLTGLEYINFMADVFGVSTAERRERTERLAARFELTEALSELVKGYSHGMRQKLVLIGALVHDPSVLVLDEPMSGLDPRAAHLLKDILRQRCDQGKTVFLSTHVLDVAERICDEVAIINRGRLIASGTVEEIRRRAGSSETLEGVFLAVTEGSR